jgi:hypothetical protein
MKLLVMSPKKIVEELENGYASFRGRFQFHLVHFIPRLLVLFRSLIAAKLL